MSYEIKSTMLSLNGLSNKSISSEFGHKESMVSTKDLDTNLENSSKVPFSII